MRWLAICLSCVLLCGGVSTCGQKGPLRLPDDSRAAPAPAHVLFS